MKRWLRVLLIVAPAIVLLLGVPAGVAFARRTPQSLPAAIGPTIRATDVPGAPGQPGENPTGPFVGPRPFIGPRLPVSTAQNGIAGVITRVGPQGIVVYTKAKKVAFITIDAKTTIRFNGKNVKLSDLQRGDRVTILGSRNTAGAFHAELIRTVRPARPDPLPGNAR